MLDHDAILEELVRQLDAGTVRAKDVAAHLAIAPARVTEMKGGKRRIQPHEMAPLAEYLGLREPPLRQTPVTTAKIPFLGKVAQGVWLEQTFDHPDDREYIDYDMEPGDPAPTDLFSVLPEGQSMNRVFMPGTKLICRRVPFGLGQFKSGDYVVVERTAHDLREMTCKQVHIDDEGNYWLRSQSDQPQFQEPIFIGAPDNGHHHDYEIRVIGKVIRAVLSFE